MALVAADADFIGGGAVSGAPFKKKRHEKSPSCSRGLVP